jgi:hypothetical protein
MMQLLEHASSDRVKRFRAIQCDKNTAALFLVKDLFVINHLFSTPMGID